VLQINDRLKYGLYEGMDEEIVSSSRCAVAPYD
jgi:hypothetical protein